MIKKLKICSSIYDIKYKGKLVDEQNARLFGEIKIGDQVIIINNKSHPQKQLQTIFHEAIHGIGREYGIKMDEDINERMSNALYAFMLDNKEFIREIVNG